MSSFEPLFRTFSHPDFTVGSGFTPDQPHGGSRAAASLGTIRGFTAGKDFHLAPKVSLLSAFRINILLILGVWQRILNAMDLAGT